jgi:hypothetical protein
VQLTRRIARRLRRPDTKLFAHLDAFCMFIGYPRTGHSLIGAIIDAHPEAAIAHEANVLRLVAEARLSRARLFQVLYDDAAERAATGRMQSGYSYAIPGQWQGRSTTLRVIGDKSGGKSSRRLIENPGELVRLHEVVQLPLRILHVTRNPFDAVARMSKVTKNGELKETLQESIERFTGYARVNADVLDDRDFDILTIRHEEFVGQPREQIERVLSFLGLVPGAEYLDACIAVVRPSTHHTRNEVEWTQAQKDELQSVIERYPFFAGYSFSSE